MVYIGGNNISGDLKKEFDTLAKDRGMEINIDKPKEGMNILEQLLMMQSLRQNAPHVGGQGEGGEGEGGEHSQNLGQMMMQALGGLLMQTGDDEGKEEGEGEEEKKGDCTQF